MESIIARFEAPTKDKMIEFTFGITSSTDSKVSLAIAVKSDREASINFDVDLENKTLIAQTPSLIGLSGTAVCLISCGLTASIPDIMDCLKKAKPPKAKNFIKCLKGKGILILSNVAACALGCFSGGGGSDTLNI